MLRHTPRAPKALTYSPKGDLFATGSNSTVILWDATSGAERSRIQLGDDVLTSMAFFPDGSRLVISRRIPTIGGTRWTYAVQIVELKDKTFTTIARPVPGGNPLVAVSPNGRYVAFEEKDLTRTVKVVQGNGKEVERPIHQVHLWDKRRESVVQKLDAPILPLRAIVFSGDGKYVAAAASSDFVAASEATPVLVWETATGKRVGEFTGHSAGMCSLAFSPDGSVLAGGGGDRKIHFWEVKTGKYLSPIVTDSSHQLAWSPRNNVLASWEMSGLSACLWNPKTGKLIRELMKAEERCQHLAFSPDGKQIVSTGRTPAIRIWDVATGKETRLANGHTATIYSLAFSPNGALLASRSGDNTVRLWDRAKHTTRYTLTLTPDSSPRFPGPFSSYSAGLSFSHDGSLLAANYVRSIGAEIKARVWDVDSGKERAALGKDFLGLTNGIAVAPNGKGVVTAGTGGTRLYSLPVGNEVPSFFGAVEDKERRVSDWCVAVSPAGRLVVAGNNADMLRFWDLTTGRRLREISTVKLGAQNAVFSPDGRILATGGGRHRGPVAKWYVQLWDVATGKPLATIGGDQDEFFSFAFSPDGRLLATADHKENRVRVWSVFTGKEMTRFDGHTADVYCVAFSPDGKILASAGADSTILLWDVSKLDGRLPAVAATPAELERCWTALRSPDAAGAFKSVRTLIQAGDAAVERIGKELKPVAVPDSKRVGQWLKDLDAERFEVRETAEQELARLGDVVEGAIQKLLDGTPSAEAKRRLTRLLDRIPVLPEGSDAMRTQRALLVLEQIGSTKAQECLRALAKGSESARLSREAKAALQRLERRAGSR